MGLCAGGSDLEGQGLIFILLPLNLGLRQENLVANEAN